MVSSVSGFGGLCSELVSRSESRRAWAMNDLQKLCPEGYEIRDPKKFASAVQMAGQQGIMPERFASVLAKKPHVVRMWGLEKIELEGAA